MTFLIITLLFLVFFFLALAPYFVRIFVWIYARLKIKTVSQRQPNPKDGVWPKISVVLPVYNEERIISQKLQNLLSLDYPKDRFEVIVVDGCSNDKTIDIINSFESVNVLLVKNKKREGVTQATKDGAATCTGDIIVLTDTEAMFDTQALRFLADDLSDSSVGAISGVEKIVNPEENHVTKMENTHRTFYNTFSLSESTLYSTAYFRGEFAAIRRNLFPTNASSERGILDVEIALAAIKAGKKAKCDPRITFYGLAANNAKDRNRQKIQRATLNQESIIQNRGLLGSPNLFGRVIFPCQFAMHITSPLFFVAALCIFPLAIIELPWQTSLAILLLISGVFLIHKFRNISLTFIQAQFYLLAGLLKATVLGRPKFLEQVESTRRAFEQL